MSFAASLERSLPKPNYTGEDEEIAQHAHPRAVRIISGALAESQIVSRASQVPPRHREISSNSLMQKSGGAPPYPRNGWKPRASEIQDYFGDGGAYPELIYAQYPQGMGRGSDYSRSSTALSIKVDSEGKIRYDELAKVKQRDNQTIQASFADLIPLRQRVAEGSISLDRPSEEEVASTTERTKAALEKLVGAASIAQKPKMVNVSRADATYVRYTPSGQFGNDKKGDRIMKIVSRAQDPMEPPKFKVRVVVIREFLAHKY